MRRKGFKSFLSSDDEDGVVDIDSEHKSSGQAMKPFAGRSQLKETRGEEKATTRSLVGRDG